MANRPRTRLLFFTATALLLAGCGGSHAQTGAQSRDPAVPVPTRVPNGAVAIVGAASIATASFEHWLPIVQQRQAAEGTSVPTASQAHEDTVSFLVGAQWLQQEAAAEGINQSVLSKLVSEQTAHSTPQSGMTRSDQAFQARLSIISEALQKRHSDKTAATTSAQIARYYTAHRSQFVNPAVRHTRMVVTHSRGAALAAKAALARGESWRTVAKRWSVDSSAQIGGAFAVVEGEQPPALEQAAFAARRGQLVGPVKTPPEASAPAAYYLFEVKSARSSSPQPLSEVASQIKETLTQQIEQRAWGAFSTAYERRWRARTLCAPGYVVAECRNYAAPARGRAP